MGELDMALVAEGGKRAGLLWVAAGPDARAWPAWHVWADGVALLVCDGLEQPQPDLVDGARVRVTLPSKDTRGRLATFTATATVLPPGTEEWEQAAAALHAQRLNPPDGEQQPARWARESRVVRLVPTGEVLEAPGRMPTGSGAAPVLPTPATTRDPLPFVIGRGTGRRRRGRGRGAGAPAGR
jgi:hypothetical protein